jgi:hypothetical protein
MKRTLMKTVILWLPLMILPAQAATVEVPLAPGQSAGVQCSGDTLTVVTPTPTEALLVCTATSPFRGVDATGAGDVTDAINAVLAALPNGTTVRFPPNATYRIEGTLRVENKDGITIDGQGSLFFAATDGNPARSSDPELSVRYAIRNRAHWRVRRSRNITLRNMVIVGSSTSCGPDGTFDRAREAQHGIDIFGSADVLVERVDISRVWGDLVYVGGPTPSTNVTVQDSRLVCSSRQGIAIVHADRVTFQRSHLDQARRTLIDLEPNRTGDRLVGVHILNNELGASRFHTVSIGGPRATVQDVTIDGNRLVGPGAFRVHIAGHATKRRRNIAVTNNQGRTDQVLQSQNEAFVVAKYVDDLTVTGNRASFTTYPRWPGIWLVDRREPAGAVVLLCSTGTVRGNVWRKATGIPDLAQRCP